MPFENQKSDPVGDASVAGQHEASEDVNSSTSNLPPVFTPLQPPQPPATPPHSPAKKYDRHKVITSAVEIVDLSVLIVYTVFSCLQWLQIRWTNRLTREALNDSNTTLQQTLAKMQGQIDATNRLYGETQKQTTQVTHMATNSGIQAGASQRGANSAQSAADTASETLRISQRAYITTGVPVLIGNIATISLQNIGHIPSGIVNTVLHEQVAASTSSEPGSVGTMTEQHWEEAKVMSVATGSPFQLNVSVPNMDVAKTSSGSQYVSIAGTINFDDGFPEDGKQYWYFCWQTNLIAGQVAWGACDPIESIEKMRKGDHYPSEEYHLRH